MKNRPPIPGTRTVSAPYDKGPLQSLPPMVALGIVLTKLEALQKEPVKITQADCDAIAGRVVVEARVSGGLILTVGDKVELDG